MFVVIGNPPYNAKQLNENDNNKNRKYPTMGRRVHETYSQASSATLKQALADPYVKAIRWAADRIGEEGIVALVTNNGFLSGVATDGMRKHLAEDFDTIYVLDMGGNVRKNPKLSGTTHNVFGIQVGVSINFLVKKCGEEDVPTKVFYARVDEFWRKEEKYRFLDAKEQFRDVEWQLIEPDKRHTWLTEGFHAEYDDFMLLGSKIVREEEGEVSEVIFHELSSGVLTARDAWAHNFNRQVLIENIRRMFDTYNEHVFRWNRLTSRAINVDDFVSNDSKKIKWSETLKRNLKSGRIAEFEETRIRWSLYRPFTQSYLFFDRVLIDRVLLFPFIIPTQEREAENRVICVTGLGSEKPFLALMANKIVDLNMVSPGAGGSQCFPFYIYNEDGSNRRENITAWALDLFRAHYRDDKITKWDVFHYVYSTTPSAASRRSSCPADFHAFADRGRPGPQVIRREPEYSLGSARTVDWRVEKMRLSKDKLQLYIYTTP